MSLVWTVAPPTLCTAQFLKKRIAAMNQLILITYLLNLLIIHVSLSNAAATGNYFSYNSSSDWKDIRKDGNFTVVNGILQ
jgi:hypothetical protein